MKVIQTLLSHLRNLQSAETNPTKRGLAMLLNGLLALAGFAAVGLGLLFLSRADAVPAATGVGCGLALLLLATVDRFEVIKGVGIEARTKDLNRKIENAEEILAQVREITVEFAPSLVSLAAHAGRHSGPLPSDLVYGLVRAADKLLTAAEVDRVAVRAALAPWVRVATMDLTSAIISPLIRDAHREYQERLREIGRLAPVNDDSPLRTELQGKCDVVTNWMSVLERSNNWSVPQCSIELRRIVASLPDYVDTEVAAEFRREVAIWAAAIEHLQEHAAFKDPETALARLKAIHSEN